MKKQWADIVGVERFLTPLGEMTVQATPSAVVAIDWGEVSAVDAPPSRLTESAKQELLEYFRGARRRFDIPLELRGTPFQQKVWRELLRIPWGEVRSYGDVAQRIGHPKAARAVGLACRTNPIAAVVPCHRVVGKNGALTGYWGGVEIKKALLDREREVLPLL